MMATYIKANIWSYCPQFYWTCAYDFFLEGVLFPTNLQVKTKIQLPDVKVCSHTTENGQKNSLTIEKLADSCKELTSQIKVHCSVLCVVLTDILNFRDFIYNFSYFCDMWMIVILTLYSVFVCDNTTNIMRWSSKVESNQIYHVVAILA